MLLWMGDAAVHELYTAACGLYIIWLVCRVGSVLVSWVPLGWKGVAMKFFEWFLLVSSSGLSVLKEVRHNIWNHVVVVTVGEHRIIPNYNMSCYEQKILCRNLKLLLFLLVVEFDQISNTD